MSKLYVIGNMALDVIADPATIRPDDITYFSEGTGHHYKAGGGGPYSFFAALASGAQAELITSGTSDHPLIQAIKQRPDGTELPIHTLNDSFMPMDDDITSLSDFPFVSPFPDFMPVFDGGHRTLYSHRDGFKITPRAIEGANIQFEQGSTFLVAPVKGEATLELIQYLSERGQVIGTIQGWMRSTDNESRVISKPISDEFAEALKLHSLVIFSDEDEAGLSPEDQLKLRALPGMAIRTEGDKGSTIYTKEEVEGQMRLVERHYPAFSLSAEMNARINDSSPEGKVVRERSFTGCGDATGATFAHNMLLGVPPHLGYRDTALTIALKIAEAVKGGKGGIEGTPPVEDIISYTLSQQGEEEYNQYCLDIEAAHKQRSIYNPQARK